MTDFRKYRSLLQNGFIEFGATPEQAIRTSKIVLDESDEEFRFRHLFMVFWLNFLGLFSNNWPRIKQRWAMIEKECEQSSLRRRLILKKLTQFKLARPNLSRSHTVIRKRYTRITKLRM